MHVSIMHQGMTVSHNIHPGSRSFALLEDSYDSYNFLSFIASSMYYSQRSRAIYDWRLRMDINNYRPCETN